MKSKLSEERIALILKVVEWAQKKGVRVQNLKLKHLKQAIRCKM